MKVLNETLAKLRSNYNVEIGKQLAVYLELGSLDLLTAVNSTGSECTEEVVEVDMGILPRLCLKDVLARYIDGLNSKPDIYNLSGYPDFINVLSGKVASDDAILKLTPALAVAALGIIYALVNYELGIIIHYLTVGRDSSNIDETLKSIFYLMAASDQILKTIKVTNYDGFPLWGNNV